MRALRRTAIMAAAIAATAVAPSAASATITATGTSHGVVNNGSLTMVIQCEAAGVGAYASVAINACYTTNGVNAPTRALPANAVATAGTGNGALQPYSLCISASGVDINGNTRSTGLRCSNALLPTAGGLGAVFATA